ncbi:MAG TPA: hypothetical protein PLC15_06160, partial [Candidatus Obscuribacter sp.]|nr:hypothetical protein [Candidatus Obscuribacter sp.]
MIMFVVVLVFLIGTGLAQLDAYWYRFDCRLFGLGFMLVLVLMVMSAAFVFMFMLVFMLMLMVMSTACVNMIMFVFMIMFSFVCHVFFCFFACHDCLLRVY